MKVLKKPAMKILETPAKILNTPPKGNMPHVAVMIAIPIMAFTMAAWMLNVQETGVFDAIPLQREMPSLAFWIRCLILSFPSVLYKFIWTNGMRWNSFFCGKGVEWYHRFCFTLRALQLYTFYSACFPGSSFLSLDFGAISAHLANVTLAGWIFLATWLAVGQALNVGVYWTIGAVGVYYGFKMGHQVPWATGFPFSLGIRHAQYTGACISFVAFLPLLCTTAGLHNGLLGMYLFVFLYYTWNAKFEEEDDNPEEQKKEE